MGWTQHQSPCMTSQDSVAHVDVNVPCEVHAPIHAFKSEMAILILKPGIPGCDLYIPYSLNVCSKYSL